MAPGGEEPVMAAGSAGARANGDERRSDTAVGHRALGWLVRLGCAASAVLLTGLVVGDVAATLYSVVLAEVAIAFLLITILVPRGL